MRTQAERYGAAEVASSLTVASVTYDIIEPAQTSSLVSIRTPKRSPIVAPMLIVAALSITATTPLARASEQTPDTTSSIASRAFSRQKPGKKISLREARRNALRLAEEFEISLEKDWAEEARRIASTEEE